LCRSFRCNICAAKPAASPARTLEQASQRLEARSNNLDADIALSEFSYPSDVFAGTPYNIEAQQSKVKARQLNIDRLAYQREDIETGADITDAMRAVNDVLRRQAARVSIDDVEEMMCDMQKYKEDIDEIHSIIATTVYVMDDAEIEAEFDAVITENDPGSPYQQQPVYRADLSEMKSNREPYSLYNLYSDRDSDTKYSQWDETRSVRIFVIDKLVVNDPDVRSVE
jgi:hypothetical protein